MGKPHPMELRSRVIAFVEEGHGHREAARHFRVSPRFVNDMVILKRESGGLVPKVRGNHAEGKLAPYSAWLRERIAVRGDLTLDGIVAELAVVQGVTVHRGSVGKWLHRLGLSHEETLLASEQLRPVVTERRRDWVEARQPAMANMLERLVFIDETMLKTDLVKTTGRAPRSRPDGSSPPTTSPRTNRRASGGCRRRKATTSSSCRLFARSQPHREGIFNAENPDPQSRSPNLPGPLERRWQGLRPVLETGMRRRRRRSRA